MKDYYYCQNALFMKKLIILLLFTTTFHYFCQSQSGTIEQDSLFIEVYIDKKGKIFLGDEKISLTKLEIYLSDSEIIKAKLATVFPTPMKVFSIVEKVNNLFDKFEIETIWYRDPEFTLPAWE